MTEEVKDIFTAYLERIAQNQRALCYTGWNLCLQRPLRWRRFTCRWKMEHCVPSRATVYNTFDFIGGGGLPEQAPVRQIRRFMRGRTATANMTIWFVMDCQKVIEFCDPHPQRAEIGWGVAPVQVLNHSLLLYGTARKPTAKTAKMTFGQEIKSNTLTCASPGDLIGEERIPNCLSPSTRAVSPRCWCVWLTSACALHQQQRHWFVDYNFNQVQKQRRGSFFLMNPSEVWRSCWS